MPELLMLVVLFALPTTACNVWVVAERLVRRPKTGGRTDAA